ncbi:MAG: nucleoside-diphosphate sugar epimerase [Bryobacteraceae bacterium]|nr:MAG: nucleoside-diphosphate sugar epimerase [Bryobacteraceae bacterium]
MRLWIERHRRLAIAVMLAGAAAFSVTMAYLLRFDLSVPKAQRHMIPLVAAAAVAVKLGVFFAAGLHHGWWRWTDTRDLLRLVAANFVGSAIFSALLLASQGILVPRSIYAIDFVICTALTGGLRMLARITKELAMQEPRGKGRKQVLIYGAGAAGVALARELRMNPDLGYRVAGFVDDNTLLRGEVVSGHRVMGAGRDLIRISERLRRRGVVVDEVLISMPSATGRQVREAMANCRAAGLPCRILPGLGGLVQGKGLSGQLREVALEDLLGREPIRLDKAQISAKLKGRVVLVTGAAGSIGRVLSHQIAMFEPELLVLADQSESGLFEIDLDVRKRHPQVRVAAAIADIRNEGDVRDLFGRHGVEVVYHAAAYKHVPLMEAHPVAALHTNVLGTWNLARTAFEAGVRSFVMISSDKAVNPVNVMGATKRAAELVVSSFNELDGGRTRYMSVRFGNVLGSSGSVVPIFQKQIAEGGPVTVTHPEVRRFFMLTEEAVQLVLQASAMGEGGEVFVLDMGELIRIADLAANMIRLAGLEPNEDIEIRYTGLRPGEKLYEEVITDGEWIAPTSHEKIKVFRGEPARQAAVAEWVARARQVVERRDEAGAVALLKEIAPEFEVGSLWKDKLSQKGWAEVDDTRGARQ